MEEIGIYVVVIEYAMDHTILDKVFFRTKEHAEQYARDYLHNFDQPFEVVAIDYLTPGNPLKYMRPNFEDHTGQWPYSN